MATTVSDHSTLDQSASGKSDDYSGTTIGQYLIERLYELGVRHIFGIPGDYVLSFYKMLENGPLRLVGTATELGAGYAADAYARVNGLGAACVTYSVGGLNLANATACAYAEKSPVVIISGAPGLRERKPNLFLHHTVQGYTTQLEVFRRLTVSSCVLEDPLTAFREIDRVLGDCLRYKRPVYIEFPRDRVASTRVSLTFLSTRNPKAIRKSWRKPSPKRWPCSAAVAGPSSSPASKCTASVYRTWCSKWPRPTTFPSPPCS